MKYLNPEDKAKFMVLRSFSTCEMFFTDLSNQDPTKMEDGSVGYEVIAKVTTIHEAQTILCGREFADKEQAKRRAEGRED